MIGMLRRLGRDQVQSLERMFWRPGKLVGAVSAFLALFALSGVANAQLSGGLQFPGPGTAHSASVGPPSATYRTTASISSATGSTSISQAALDIVNAAADLQLIVGITVAADQTITGTPTITPDGGGAINGTVVKSDTANDANVSILQFAIPNGTDLTNATLAYTLTGGIFNGSRAGFWTIPTADMVSTTGTVITVTSASATSASITTLPTSTGGTVIAVGMSADPTPSTTWGGIASGGEDYDTAAFAAAHSGAHANGLSASGGATVSATFTGSGAAVRVTAVTYR